MRKAPRARRDGLLVEEMPGEVLVYDLETHRAHCLNGTAALVWRSCDGETPLAEIARRVERELGTKDGDALVSLALARLSRAKLLADRVTKRVTRRAFARRLALTTALLPAVSSVLAPTPAQAATGCVTGMCKASDVGVSCCGALCTGMCIAVNNCDESMVYC